MFGDKGFVEKDIHVIIVRCSCHIIHPCASYACRKMWASLEDMFRNIYSHFSRYAQPKYTWFRRVSKILSVSNSQINQSFTSSLIVDRECSKKCVGAAAVYPSALFHRKVADETDSSNTVKTILQPL